jgi:hypothetical protein
LYTKREKGYSLRIFRFLLLPKLKGITLNFVFENN